MAVGSWADGYTNAIFRLLEHLEVPRKGLIGPWGHIPAGQRLRVSISSSYWPLAWPSPEPATLTIYAGVSSLELPVRPARAEDDPVRPFDEPEAAPPLQVTRTRPSEHHWRMTRDLAAGTSTLEIVNDQGAFCIEETGTTIRRVTNEWYTVTGNDLTSARGETRTERRLERDDWQVAVYTRTVLTCTPDEFVLSAQVDAHELDGARGDPRVHSETWNRRIPRDHV